MRVLDSAAAYKRLTRGGFPRRFAVLQVPNPPLIVALVAGQVARHVGSPAHDYIAAVGYLAWIVWAYEELAHGVNWFRRLVGLAFAILTVVRLAHALPG